MTTTIPHFTLLAPQHSHSPLQTPSLFLWCTKSKSRHSTLTADINRSVFAVTKVTWRGELSVVCAGRYVPYHKYMKDGHKASLTVKRYENSFMIPPILTLMTSNRFAEVFKQCRTVRKFVSRMIFQ